MSEKTVFVLPRHSPKSGVRNEKTFFFKFFFLLGHLKALLPRYLSRYPHYNNYWSCWPIFTLRYFLMLNIKQGSCEYQLLKYFGLTSPGNRTRLRDGC